MVLYTYQSNEAYETLMNTGVLRITEETRRFTLPMQEGWSDIASEAYEYMTDRTKRLVGEPPAGVVSPIWAWYRLEGRAEPTPENDLVYPGRKRIKFSIDSRRAALSDYTLFSFYCMNNWVLPMDEAEQELELTGVDSAVYDYYKKATWDRIFCRGWRDDGYVFGGVGGRSIQATLWELRREQIIEVKDIPDAPSH